MADFAGLPIYLECAGENLPGLYRHFGFEPLGEMLLELPKGDGDWPPQAYTAMVREPAAPG